VTADQERQRSALMPMLFEARYAQKWGGCVDRELLATMADFLLANGVSVDLPPEPEIKPGTTGTAMLPHHGRARVMRVDGSKWVTPYAGYQGVNEYDDDEATDFTPDPEPLTHRAACVHVMELAKRLHRIGETRGMDLSDEDKALWKANLHLLDGSPDFQRVAEWLEVAADMDEGGAR
jgi:hypothetical protein